MPAPGTGRRTFVRAGFTAAAALVWMLSAGDAAGADTPVASPSSSLSSSAGLLGGDAELLAWELASAALAGAAQPDAIDEAQRLLRDVQARYLEPCFLGRHATCRGNMLTLIGQLRTRLNLTVTQWSRFQPIRNNMFFYRVAPNLRLAVAISQSARDCSGWMAAAKSDGATLSGLLEAAEREVGGRRSLPEARELEALRTRFSSCTSGNGAD